MSEKLENCPFCGGTLFQRAEAGQIHDVPSVQCLGTSCIIEGEWFRVDDWQIRYYPPEVVALIEAARDTDKNRETYYSNAHHAGHEMHMYDSLQCLSDAIRNLDKLEES